MNYTENYHLPQWVKSDRIMMEDFNQMCADIEDGLTEKETHLSGLDRGLFRLAYNHLHALGGRDPQPPQLGAFYHNPYNDPVPAHSFEGSQLINLSSGPAPTSVSDFIDSFELVSAGEAVAGDPSTCDLLVYRFSSPAAGYISRLYIWEHFTAVTGTRYYHIKLKNLNTGVVEWDKRVDSSNEVGSLYIRAPFCSDVPYHLILALEEPVASGKVTLWEDHQGNNIIFLADRPGFTLTRTLDDFEGSQGGLVLVRCRPNGAGGTVTLTWNGEVYQPSAVRMQPVEGELPIHELLFIRREPLPAKNELSLDVRCSVGGSLNFYDWGAMLF